MHNKERNIYQGVITAMVTPYEKDKQGNLAIDYAVFGELVKKQLIAGVNGIVIAGSTGEGTCLKMGQVAGLLAKAKEIRSEYKESYKDSSQIDSINKFAIICGLSSASTADALETLECINEAAIDGVMLTSPYYVKPSRAGARKHFQMLATGTDLQVILYSNKSRTGIEIDVEDAGELASKCPNIVAIKDSESDIIRPLRIYKQASENRKNGALNQKDNKIPFHIVSGNDENYLAFYMHGAKGVVSVISNIMPKSMTGLHKMLEEGKYEQARGLQCQLLDIYDIIYSDTNPSGIKYAASLLGLCNSDVMMPLVGVSNETQRRIKEVIPKIQEIESLYLS